MYKLIRSVTLNTKCRFYLFYFENLPYSYSYGGNFYSFAVGLNVFCSGRRGGSLLTKFPSLLKEIAALNSPVKDCPKSTKVVNAESVLLDICRVISFAISNNHSIDAKDFFHCHVIMNHQNSSTDRRTWDNIQNSNNSYEGLLFHAHEYDGLRSKNLDNYNIFQQVSSKFGPAYLGLDHTANFLDLASVEINYPSSMENQINFFKSTDSECESLYAESRILRKCGAAEYCMGFYKN